MVLADSMYVCVPAGSCAIATTCSARTCGHLARDPAQRTRTRMKMRMAWGASLQIDIVDS